MRKNVESIVINTCLISITLMNLGLEVLILPIHLLPFSFTNKKTYNYIWRWRYILADAEVDRFMPAFPSPTPVCPSI